jgi:hypothetical protein
LGEGIEKPQVLYRETKIVKIFVFFSFFGNLSKEFLLVGLGNEFEVKKKNFTVAREGVVIFV